MWKLYPYVGPAYLAKQANSETPRLRVESAATLAAWVVEQPSKDADGTLTVTFVVLPDGLWARTGTANTSRALAVVPCIRRGK